nr:hypothetical protein [Actinomadura roseirufa]
MNGPAGDGAAATPTHCLPRSLCRAVKYSRYRPLPVPGGTTSGAQVRPPVAQSGSRTSPSGACRRQGPVTDGATATGMFAAPSLVP